MFLYCQLSVTRQKYLLVGKFSQFSEQISVVRFLVRYTGLGTNQQYALIN